VAAGFGATASTDWRLIFAPTVNDPALTEAYAEAAAELVGTDRVARDNPPGMGSEDFSFMMERVPGAYIHVGNGDGAMPHNPRYAFNDEAIPYGAALFARVVERALPKG
jgi:hippurate hydrolase